MTIAVERCIVSRDLTEPRLGPDGSCVVFVVAAGGTAALFIDTLDGAPQRQLSAYPPPRPGRGMGGGCWCWSAAGDAIVYAAIDGELWLQPVPNGAVRRLTRHGPDRIAAAPVPVADGSRVVYVIDEAEVWAVRVDDGSCERLDDGSADFVFDPSVAPDSQTVAWQAWNVPDMPWDASRSNAARSVDSRIDDVTLARIDPTDPLHARRRSGLPTRRHRLAQRVAGRSTAGRRGIRTRWPDMGNGPAFVRRIARCDQGGLRSQRSGLRKVVRRRRATGDVREVARGVHGQLSWQGGRLCALRSVPARRHRSSCTTTRPGHEPCWRSDR
jgi:Tol biopolymer transport system component